MPISVKELRLSLVWTKAFYQDSNLPVLADPAQYIHAFDQARSSSSQPWQLPWISGRPQHFWQYYLKPVAPDNFEHVTNSNARSYFVPLRVPRMSDAVARDGAAATFEGYCFPHSTAVIATICLRPEPGLSLTDAGALALATRNADYQLTWKDNAPATHGTLQSLAQKIVDRVNALAQIAPAALGTPLGYPITITTIIDADGEEKTDPAILGQTLKALLALRSDWRTLDIPIPATTADSDIAQLLPFERGRAIWNPTHFSAVEAKGRRTANGCYHRNLTLAAMQTAALLALLVRAEEVLADPNGQLFAVSFKDVSNAIKLLAELSAGDDTTYRSWSIRHQISFHTDRIKAVASKLGE